MFYDDLHLKINRRSDVNHYISLRIVRLFIASVIKLTAISGLSQGASMKVGWSGSTILIEYVEKGISIVCNVIVRKMINYSIINVVFKLPDVSFLFIPINNINS